MYSLIIAAMAIVLEAAALFALLSTTPRWTRTAPDFSRVVAAGISNAENAFWRHAIANNGTALTPTAATDGGLSNFMGLGEMAFFPAAPAGYAWKYGINTYSQYYVCLYQTGGAAATQEVYQGMKRLRRLLPYERYVLHTGGAGACGTLSAGNVDPDSAPPGPNDPANYPADISITYFMKYIPGQRPASSVLPCSENECLSSPML